MTFPTSNHAKTAELIAGFFEHRPSVDTVLLVNSTARNKATGKSDLDVAVLVGEGTTASEMVEMEAAWTRFASSSGTVTEFLNLGPYTKIHLDLFDGRFVHGVWGESGGPDNFDIEIGNRIANSLPIHGSGRYFRELQSLWLPFYDRDLRNARLSMVGSACAYDIERVSYYFERHLPFHAFDILYKAYQEFLQAVFISRQTYPIAYNKWIQEQVVEWLELPELFDDLPKVLSIADIESESLLASATLLSSLLQRWVVAEEAESPEG